VKKFLIIGALVVIGAVIINYTLGGFEPVQPSLISSQTLTLYGQHYEGRYNSEALDELIANLRKRIDESENEAVLTIVNYNQEELEKRGVVKQFVGINWKALPLENNTDLDSITIEQYNGVQFAIPIKPLVMPSPEKLKKEAEAMAESMNTELVGLSIEQYQNNSLIINYPFKTN
jgi:hypothetical protein